MNIFKKTIKNTKSDKERLQNEVLEFSNKLRLVMELNNSDIKEAIENNIYWIVGNYYITPRSVCLSPGWKDMLFAIPIDMKTHNIGWSNIACQDPDPEKFTYLPSGTSTLILAKPDEQRKILDEVKKYSVKSTQ